MMHVWGSTTCKGILIGILVANIFHNLMFSSGPFSFPCNTLNYIIKSWCFHCPLSLGPINSLLSWVVIMWFYKLLLLLLLPPSTFLLTFGLINVIATIFQQHLQRNYNYTHYLVYYILVSVSLNFQDYTRLIMLKIKQAASSYTGNQSHLDLWQGLENK